jgi:hypothetical protein
MTRILLVTSLVALLPAALPAQQATFAVVRGTDTVASESFAPDSAGLSGTLVRGTAASRERIKYQITMVEGLTPLVELAAWRGDDPEGAKARQNVRVIFKEDSVAVDEANDRSGVSTRLFETQRNAVPYLNLSCRFLQLATQRAAGQDSVSVPFFNLNGGQTISGLVKRIDRDSVTLDLGRIQFRLRVDPSGTILGGSVPSQGLTIVRGGAT